MSKEKFELLTKEQLKAITEEQLSTLNQAEQLSITVNIRFYGAKGKKDDTSEGEASQGDESEWI